LGSKTPNTGERVEVTMAFLLFAARKEDDGHTVLSPTGEEYRLARLIRAAWEARARPLNEGWHASADDLVQIHSEGRATYETLRLLIDFHPSATWRVGIMELLDVYGYTFGDDKDVWWTPLMLRLREIINIEDWDTAFDETRKIAVLARLNEPKEDNESVEFLYLQSNWTWGRNGSVNAAFINNGARNYFKKFF
jgi:hypothetical protein